LARLASDAGVLVDKRASRVFFGGATATVDALSFARQALGLRDLAAVCVLGVDSLSTQPRLGKLLREKSSQAERFVPGEAAAALLFTRRLGSDSLAILAGIGASSSDTDEKPSNQAKNSISAIERALSDAELSRAPIAAFVHDLPATQAGDEELTWLHGGSILATPGFSVLAPSSSAGEIGAASGILSLATLAFLMEKREINGLGLCIFASADGSRGAAVLTPAKRKHVRQ
jgi:3-oxoacyl-(acyl-carrier-protein) synthase